MSPITFSIDEMVSASPDDIARQFLDLDRWRAFQGFGSIPAISNARFETKKENLVGATIRITNSDGSSNLATISEWQPDTRVSLKMTDFIGPLVDLVTSIEQILEFEADDRGTTKVTRYVHIHPKSEEAITALHDIALDLKKAILIHSHSKI